MSLALNANGSKTTEPYGAKTKWQAFLLVLAVLGATILGTFVGIAPASAAPAASKVVHYCNFGSAWENWDSHKASSCPGIYEIKKGGTVVVKVNHATTADWKAIKAAVDKGTSTAQNYCNTHTLTCGVLIAIGVGLLIAAL